MAALMEWAQMFNVDIKRPAKVEEKPFRHVVLDNFLDADLADVLEKHFPSATPDWYKYDNVFERKSATDRIEQMPVAHMWAALWFNSQLFVDFLEKTFEMPGIIPDPHLRGGGLHQIYPGGKLDIHADFNKHLHLNLDRRLNALLYLNSNWQIDWGGHLELWDDEMGACQKRIAPILNRLVVFETTDFSFHGHPDPLRCPDGVTRKSMAWYYYTNGRPEHEISKPHSTLFKRRPFDNTTPDIEELREKRNKGRLDATT